MRVGDARERNLTRINNTGDGKIATGATVYHELHTGGDLITSIQLYWPDATSHCPVELQGTNFLDVAFNDTGKKWKVLPVAITGPAAAAEDSEMIDVSGLGESRMRLKIGPAVADTQLYVRCNGKQ